MVNLIGKQYYKLGVEQQKPNVFADMLKSMFTPQQNNNDQVMVVEDLEMD